MESWRHTWQVGFAPQMSREELLTLHTALVVGDPALCHGAGCLPRISADEPPLPITAADPIIFGAWKLGEVRDTVEAYDLWAARSQRCDDLLGEPTGCRWFVVWWDDAPSAEARRLLSDEIWHHVFGCWQAWHSHVMERS